MLFKTNVPKAKSSVPSTPVAKAKIVASELPKGWNKASGAIARSSRAELNSYDPKRLTEFSYAESAGFDAEVERNIKRFFLGYALPFTLMGLFILVFFSLTNFENSWAPFGVFAAFAIGLIGPFIPGNRVYKKKREAWREKIAFQSNWLADKLKITTYEASKLLQGEEYINYGDYRISHYSMLYISDEGVIALYTKKNDEASDVPLIIELDSNFFKIEENELIKKAKSLDKI